VVVEGVAEGEEGEDGELSARWSWGSFLFLYPSHYSLWMAGWLFSILGSGLALRRLSCMGAFGHVR
jgi:hypothetical protein